MMLVFDIQCLTLTLRASIDQIREINVEILQIFS